MSRIYATDADEVDWRDVLELEESPTGSNTMFDGVDRCHSARNLHLEVCKEGPSRSCMSVDHPTPTGEHGSPSSSTSHLLTLPFKPQLRRCRSASPAVVRAQLLSPEQQQMIKKSWQRVSRSAIGKAVYQQMNSKCPETRAAFMSDFSAIERHERYFVDLIQGAVDNLNDLEDALRPWLEMLGKGHQGFAIKASHWDNFGEAMTSAISAWIGPGRHRKETVRAWRTLFSFISDRLCSALHKTRGSSNLLTTPRIQLLTLVTDGPINSPT